MSVENVRDQKTGLARTAFLTSALLIGVAWGIVGADEYNGISEKYAPMALDIADKAAIVSTAALVVSCLWGVANLFSNLPPKPKR
jgi:hypothetical protein